MGVRRPGSELTEEARRLQRSDRRARARRRTRLRPRLDAVRRASRHLSRCDRGRQPASRAHRDAVLVPHATARLDLVGDADHLHRGRRARADRARRADRGHRAGRRPRRDRRRPARARDRSGSRRRHACTPARALRRRYHWDVAAAPLVEWCCEIAGARKEPLRVYRARPCSRRSAGHGCTEPRPQGAHPAAGTSAPARSAQASNARVAIAIYDAAPSSSSAHRPSPNGVFESMGAASDLAHRTCGGPAGARLGRRAAAVAGPGRGRALLVRRAHRRRALDPAARARRATTASPTPIAQSTASTGFIAGLTRERLRLLRRDMDAPSRPSRGNLSGHSNGTLLTGGYPPEYYLLGAVAYEAPGLHNATGRLYAIRVVSALLGGLAALLIFRLLLAAGVPELLSVLGTAAFVQLPMFTQSSAIVNPDILLSVTLAGLAGEPAARSRGHDAQTAAASCCCGWRSRRSRNRSAGRPPSSWRSRCSGSVLRAARWRRRSRRRPAGLLATLARLVRRRGGRRRASACAGRTRRSPVAPLLARRTSGSSTCRGSGS